MPDIEYNTFHPAAAEDNEEGTLLPPSLSGTTTSAGGEEEVETRIAAVLSPSKKIGLGVLFVGFVTIVVTTISKNNAGNRTSATELPVLATPDWCCSVTAPDTFSGSPDEPTSKICWQAYEGDLSDSKPVNPPQFCWTEATYLLPLSDDWCHGTWEACKPLGSWKFVNRAAASGDCSDRCEELDLAC